jgi:short-subunit dehydrogenase
MSEERASEPAIVITGASSGIGRAFASVVQGEAAAIVCIGRSQEALAQLADELHSSGARVHAVCVDLSEAEAGAQIESALADRNLHCDVLINSAGLGAFGNAASLPRSEQLGIIEVNIRALMDLTLRFLPAMVARGRGGIVNIGSTASYAGGPSMAAYYASKAFVRSFSEALWAETRGSGVTVTCVSAGPTQTAFFARSRAGRARLFKLLPRMSAHRVAEAGWRAFKSGRRVVIPGNVNRVTVALMSIAPRSAVLTLIARLQRQH